MEADHYPQNAIDGAKEHEDSLLSAKVQEASDEALQHEGPSINQPRFNELKTLFKKDVEFIARGINVWVDVQVLPPQLLDQQQAPPATMTELRQLGQQINTLTRTLPDRSAPLAELPSPRSRGAKKK